SVSAASPASAAPASSSAECSWLSLFYILDLGGEDVEHGLHAGVLERLLPQLLLPFRTLRGPGDIGPRRRGRGALDGDHRHAPAGKPRRDVFEQRTVLLELRAERLVVRAEREDDPVAVLLDPLRLRDDGPVEELLDLADFLE